MDTAKVSSLGNRTGGLRHVGLDCGRERRRRGALLHVRVEDEVAVHHTSIARTCRVRARWRVSWTGASGRAETGFGFRDERVRRESLAASADRPQKQLSAFGGRPPRAPRGANRLAVNRHGPPPPGLVSGCGTRPRPPGSRSRRCGSCLGEGGGRAHSGLGLARWVVVPTFRE
jgi:hypothetical protein